MEISIRLLFSPSGNRNMRSWCKLFLWLLFCWGQKEFSLSLWPRELFFYVTVCVCVCVCVCSVQFSGTVMSNSLWPHELQHARPPCPSPIPRVYSNSCPSSQWCHPTISFSVIPFSSCLQSFPGSGSFQMSQLLASGGQSIGVSALAWGLIIQNWFLLGWTGWISLLSNGLSRVFSNTTVQKHQFFSAQLSL